MKGQYPFSFHNTIETIFHSKVPKINRWPLTDCLLFFLFKKSR